MTSENEVGTTGLDSSPRRRVLKAGAAADIIVMDYKPFTPFSDANIA